MFSIYYHKFITFQRIILNIEQRTRQTDAEQQRFSIERKILIVYSRFRLIRRRSCCVVRFVFHHVLFPFIHKNLPFYWKPLQQGYSYVNYYSNPNAPVQASGSGKPPKKKNHFWMKAVAFVAAMAIVSAAILCCGIGCGIGGIRSRSTAFSCYQLVGIMNAVINANRTNRNNCHRCNKCNRFHPSATSLRK